MNSRSWSWASVPRARWQRACSATAASARWRSTASATVYDKPRAIAIDHEILRILDNLGVAERLCPYIAPFPASQHFGAKGQLIRRIDMVGEPYPLGYTPSMVFTQPPVEAALRQHAQAYPDVTVELGTELTRFTQSTDGVTLHLRGDSGATRTVTADYVIACDGASSAVREQLGIAFEDLVFDEPWLVVDLQVADAALAKIAGDGGTVLRSGAADDFHHRPGPASPLRNHAVAGRGPAPHGRAGPGLATAGKVVDAGRRHAVAGGELPLSRAGGGAMAARAGAAGGRCRSPAAALHRPGHVPGHSRCRQSGLETRSGAARPIRRGAARQLRRGAPRACA